MKISKLNKKKINKRPLEVNFSEKLFLDVAATLTVFFSIQTYLFSLLTFW